MTTKPPEIFRLFVLKAVLAKPNNEEPFEYDFAIRYIFPDVTISQWCIDNDLSFDIVTYPRVVLDKAPWKFIVFKRLNNDAL
jgi:hypothetical protein